MHTFILFEPAEYSAEYKPYERTRTFPELHSGKARGRSSRNDEEEQKYQTFLHPQYQRFLHI